MNALVIGMESSLIERNAQTGVVGSAFEAVQNGLQDMFCSDCCSSNGNKCDPNDQYLPQ